MTDRKLVIIATSSSNGCPNEICDSLHDEDAPVQYLCSRCFPDPPGDLVEASDDDEEIE